MNSALFFLSITLFWLPPAARDQPAHQTEATTQGESTAQTKPARPKITGIVSVRLLTRDLSRTRPFYAKLFSQDHPCVWCGELPKVTFSVNPIQYLELDEIALSASSEIAEITFATGHVPTLWRYMRARGVLKLPLHKFARDPKSLTIPEIYELSSNDPRNLTVPDVRFSVLDPEEHEIAFVQLPPELSGRSSEKDNMRLFQVRFEVKNAAAEDQFYVDVLGFRRTPSEGTEDSEAEAPVLRVPDGTDQLKYALTVPAGSDKYALGGMNEIGVRVSDIEQTSFAFRKKGISVPDAPQIGRNGAWQSRFLDPEGMLIRLTEFTPALNRYTSQFTTPPLNQ